MLATHVLIGIVEAVLVVAVFYCQGVQRPFLLRGVLALELAFAFTVPSVTADLRNSKSQESRLVGMAYLLMASVKLMLAALLIASPAHIDLLWAHFFAHHACPWAQTFIGIFQRVGLFKEHRAAMASVIAMLVVLPCGLSIYIGGAFIVLCAACLFYWCSSPKAKQTSFRWHGYSHDHEHESSGQNSDAIDSEVDFRAEVVAHQTSMEVAEANFHREASLANISHSQQVILEDELKSERRNCSLAEAALAQLSAEHMRLISVRDDLEKERKSAQEVRTALAHLEQQPDTLREEVFHLQSQLQAAAATQEAMVVQLDVSRENALTQAEEVKQYQATLARVTADKARIESLRNQALEELSLAQQRQRTSDVWKQDADADLKVALLASEATAQQALQEYKSAETKALYHGTESARLRNSLMSLEAEVTDSKETIAELKLNLTEEAIVAQDRKQLWKLAEENSTTPQVDRSISMTSLRQTEELRASELRCIQQAEELQISERAAASAFAEWQNAEAILSTSQGFVEGLEAQNKALRSTQQNLEVQNEVLRSDISNQRLQASNEQEQIQHLRRQVQTLEEELDSREARLMRIEPLVASREQGKPDPRTSSISPARPKRPPEGNRSLSPMDAQNPVRRPVQWLPPGRAQSLIARSSPSIPGSTMSMPSSAPQFATMPPVLQTLGSPVSSPSQSQWPRSMQ